MTSDARLLFRSYSVSVPAESVEGLLTGPDLSGIPAVPDSSIPVVRVVKGSAADSRALDPDWRRRREAALSSSNPRVLLGLLRDDCASVRLAAASNPAVLTVPVGMTEAAWEDRFTEVFRLAECGEGPASLDELLEALSLAVRRSTSTAPASVQWLVDEARTAGEAAGGAGLFRLETEDGILPVRDAGTAARILIDATEDLEAERRDALLLELASVPAACVRREVCWTDGLLSLIQAFCEGYQSRLIRYLIQMVAPRREIRRHSGMSLDVPLRRKNFTRSSLPIRVSACRSRGRTVSRGSPQRPPSSIGAVRKPERARGSVPPSPNARPCDGER